jgi:hypothetical protein
MTILAALSATAHTLDAAVLRLERSIPLSGVKGERQAEMRVYAVQP